MSDRMEQLHASADEVKAETDWLYGSGGAYAAEAFMAGAHRYRTLTAEQWEAEREKVATVMRMATGRRNVSRQTFEEFSHQADAAMSALGFRHADEEPTP